MTDRTFFILFSKKINIEKGWLKSAIVLFLKDVPLLVH